MSRISENEKEMILKDSQKLTNALNSQKEDVEDDFYNKNTKNKTDNENFDMNKARKRADKNISHPYKPHVLGYQRKYLYPEIKVTNIILGIIFIILAILVICKYMAPGVLPEARF